MFAKQIPIASLLVGATVWGLFWYPYRVLAGLGISGWVAATMAYIVAILVGVLLLRRRLGSFSWMLIAIGLVSGLCNFGYVIAVIHGEVMRVLLLFYLAPCWTVVLARIMLGEKPSLAGYAVILFALIGAIVMLWNPASGAIYPRSTPEWLGLMAGMLFALTNVLSRFAEGESVEAKSIAYSGGMVVIGTTYLLVFPPDLPALNAIEPFAWGLILVMGVVVCAVNLVVLYGIKHVAANQAIVIMLFELVVAAVSSYLLAGEAMGVREWAGGAMIVAASLFSGKLKT